MTKNEHEAYVAGFNTCKNAILDLITLKGDELRMVKTMKAPKIDSETIQHTHLRDIPVDKIEPMSPEMAHGVENEEKAFKEGDPLTAIYLKVEQLAANMAVLRHYTTVMADKYDNRFTRDGEHYTWLAAGWVGHLRLLMGGDPRNAPAEATEDVLLMPSKMDNIVGAIKVCEKGLVDMEVLGGDMSKLFQENFQKAVSSNGTAENQSIVAKCARGRELISCAAEDLVRAKMWYSYFMNDLIVNNA